jgi:hypothetical protein
MTMTSRRKSQAKDLDLLLNDPKDAADQIDAILYFIHKRYGTESSGADLPTMRTFLIQSMEVVFTDSVKQITIEKRMDQPTLCVLAPKPNKFEEEARRIFLLNEFGDLLIRCQKQGVEQLREMLLGVLDDKGQNKLVSEYLKRKKKQVSINA